MDTNLIQTLWVWWGTIPSDFRFLMLLPFAIGGTAVLVDVLRQAWIAERRRLFSPRTAARRSGHSTGAASRATPTRGHRPIVRPLHRVRRGRCCPTAARATRVR